MMRRFYAPKPSFSGETVTLDPDETRHLRDVLRLRAGDEISVFDGEGGEFTACITTLTKTVATATVIGPMPPSSPESPVNITLAAVAIPSDKYDLIIQKAVELGVVNFVPLASARSEVKLKDLPKKLQRWRRIALDGAKQCGRATLMSIAEPKNVKEFLEAQTGASAQIFFSERSGTALPAFELSKAIIAVIGPKGGWDDTEIETAERNGFAIVTLGGRIMRAETAAIALTAILQHRFGDIN